MRFARSAASGSERLSPVAAQRMMGELFACTDSEITPQGKKIYVRISQEELDKKF